MNSAVTAPYVLPDDVVLTPAHALPSPLRRELACSDDDYAVRRKRSRTPSRVIDASTAELLRQFTEAKPITEAIIAFSRLSGTDAEETLVEAFPALQRLINDGLLVLASSQSRNAIESSFAEGDHIDGFVVIGEVQVLEDSEVYQAEAPDGRIVALKVARPEASSLRRVIAREAAILQILDGTASPQLVGAGEIDGRSFLATEWLEGRDVATTAHALLSRGSDRAFELAGRLLDAYTALHGQGVLHGDVHPRNTLVAPDGSVRLIDFGLADCRALASELRPHGRGGVGFFVEPEFARARIDDQRPPRVSAPGEQYSVAALVYLVLTGTHYLRFSPEKDAMRRQIVEKAPLSFLDAGISPSPGVEAVLARALAKEPAARFASLAEFATAFHDAAREDRRRPARTQDALIAAAQTIVDALLERARSGAAPALPAPAASVTYGGAGFAYGLMRLARVRQDPELLALADLWSVRAGARSGQTSAFYSAELDITPEVVGRSSPYHTLSGVYWVQACIAQAMNDVAGFRQACLDLVRASQDLSSNPDLTLGRAGTLLAFSSVVDLGRSVPLVDLSAVRAAGDAVAASLTAHLEALAPIAEERSLRFLGIAHGWSGILYALLRWQQATGLAAGGGLAARLDQLAAAAEPTAHGLRWPRLRRDGRSRPADFVPSWCNGSAGFVHLWLAAESVLGDEGYRELACGAARDALGPTETGVDLCCGLSGRAYALLALHRASGDEMWLRDARSLALRALRPDMLNSPFAHSLYKGVLGPAMLAEELRAPAAASMPLFEPEGWPREAAP
ncbi:phosphotransferase [Bradyrhizobium diazoefficiens]|nr:lanthionine synthetase LanC family protein [Bradyrhizobium diazoefficiens]MBR0851395.1 phosphotransferase [Bradyrhizobium diazoefficiens]